MPAACRLLDIVFCCLSLEYYKDPKWGLRKVKYSGNRVWNEGSERGSI